MQGSGKLRENSFRRNTTAPTEGSIILSMRADENFIRIGPAEGFVKPGRQRARVRRSSRISTMPLHCPHPPPGSQVNNYDLVFVLGVFITSNRKPRKQSRNTILLRRKKYTIKCNGKKRGETPRYGELYCCFGLLDLKPTYTISFENTEWKRTVGSVSIFIKKKMITF